MSAKYSLALKAPVYTRGVPPDSFLDELVAWGKSAPDEIFQPNDKPDIYGSVKSVLGPWNGLVHRKAVMLEVLRCLGGFESSWNWREGVDRTNRTSMTHIEGQETGIFQVSFDSTLFDPSLRECVRRYCPAVNAQNFIDKMKSNHLFALEYCARLLRFSIAWDGPIKRREIHSWLRRDAVDEFAARLVAVA
jgi:hypothetical protein